MKINVWLLHTSSTNFEQSFTDLIQEISYVSNLIALIELRVCESGEFILVLLQL